MLFRLKRRQSRSLSINGARRVVRSISFRRNDLSAPKVAGHAHNAIRFSLPFAGDYLYVSSLGSFAYGVWTDWRDTVQGTDPRESPEDEDAATADVLQCRAPNTVKTKKGPFSFWSGDLCPHAGGIDQNIYGDTTP